MSNLNNLIRLSRVVTRNVFDKTICTNWPTGARFLTGVCRLSTSSAGEMDISGIYPPITTNFHDDESIAYDKLQENMDIWNKIPFRGYVVQGSNGEYAYMSPEERVDLVARVAAMAAPGKIIVAGAGCESTRDTIQMAKKMAEAGAQAVLVITPCYYKGLMNTEALVNHYTKVADASPVPVILYSVPGNTSLDLPSEVIIKLSTHPNIVGLKDSGGDVAKLGHIVYMTQNNNFQVLAGSASFLLPAYSVGCVGGVCALANVLGQECCDLVDLFNSGSMEDAKKLQHRLIMPNIAVTKMFGIPGLKRAMEWFGYNGGPVRSPLLPLPKSNEDTLREIFKQPGFL